MLLDHDIRMDAGTGVGDLSFEELARIDHIFVTHCHLDHVCSIPLIVDTVGGVRDKPLTIYATQETIAILQEHLFNWKLWPDFSQIPRNAPLMRYQPVNVGQPVELAGRKITPLPALHVVPAVGYHIDSGEGSLVYTGDTTTNDELWSVVNEITNLRYLIIETAFSDRERDIAHASKHLCPSMLAEELSKLQRPADILITHLKPDEMDITMLEIKLSCGAHRPRMLEQGDILRF